MLDVVVTRESGAISSVVFTGTESAIPEEIAVASSVVTVLHTAILGVMQVAGVELDFVDEPGNIRFKLPETDELSGIKAGAILDAMLCGLYDLAVTFSDFFNLEVN